MQTLEIVQGLVDLPLSIDSSVTAAIEAALKVAKGRPLVNSVTGEEEKLEAILPLIKKYNVPVVAISNDETGISMDPDVRFAVAKKIVERCADFGIPPHDVVVDPLVMPIGALGDAGRQVFALLRRLREELKVNTTCGLSNISFGLPHRHGINAAFIPMVIGAGMTSAIMNPCRPQEMEAVRGANVLNGTDENCTTWIRTYKDYKPAEGGATVIAAPVTSGAAAGGRRGGRAARLAGAGGGGSAGDERCPAMHPHGRALRRTTLVQQEPLRARRSVVMQIEIGGPASRAEPRRNAMHAGQDARPAIPSRYRR